MNPRLALACIMVFLVTPALAEDGARTLMPEAIDTMIAKRVENQAKWAEYSADVTTRLLVDGEVELTMVHRATFDPEGRSSFELVREQPIKGGIFTRSIRNKKRRAMEEWRDKLMGVLNFYWSVSPGQARDWLSNASMRTDSKGSVTEYLVEGRGYAMEDDTVTVVRREGGGLPDAFRVRTVVRERKVELLLTTQALGEEGMKVPAQASVEVPEENLRLVLRYENWQQR